MRRSRSTTRSSEADVGEMESEHKAFSRDGLSLAPVWRPVWTGIWEDEFNRTKRDLGSLREYLG